MSNSLPPQRHGPASKPVRRREMNAVTVLVGVVFAGAVAVFYFGVLGRPALDPPATLPGGVPWGLFALAFAATEMAVVHLHVRRSAQTFSLSEVPLVIGLFFTAPYLLVLARVLGAAPALFVYRRQRSVKLVFNLALVGLETGTAVVIFHALLGNAAPASSSARLAAFAAAIGAGMLGTFLVGAVSSLHDGQFRLALWRRMIATGAVSFTANASLGLVTVAILQESPSALWYLLLVLAIVFAAYRGYSTVHRRHEDLELLYDFTRAIGGALHVESVGQRLLVRARDLLRAENAELILDKVDGAGHSVRLRLTAGDAVERVHEAATARELREMVVGDESVALPRTTRDEAQRRLLDHLGVKDAVLVRLPTESDVAGTVLVANRLGDVLTFADEDVRLLQTLANHASVALANGRLVDQLTEQAAEREHEALHDSLTGLPNRTLFLRELASVIAAPGAKAAVLLMDLNGFKDVNDTLGHHAGDQLLNDIGGRLQRALEGTGLVARLGGDEFAVLLPGVGGELAAKTVAHEVLAVLEQQTTIAGVRVDIGASIGISLCPMHGDEANALLQRADVAMYAAKSSHSPLEIYSAERDYHSPERLALVGELRSTLERGELRVVYQPKADLRTGRVLGVEALARWDHPERGFIPPEEFVGVAERSGLIQPLTRHMLRTALTQCRIWRLSGLPLNVSVNLSARSLLPELPAEVARILGETGVAATALTLEITESSIMADPQRTGLVLEELSAMGVHIAIDDFGTGYSSLTYLKRLPVDEIKIDKSFVLGMAGDEGDAAIVRSTVDLGRNLGLRVVAEGIEEPATWTALATLGCDMAQGYYLSPPVTPAEFDGWLRARTAADAAPHGRGRTETILPADPARHPDL